MPTKLFLSIVFLCVFFLQLTNVKTQSKQLPFKTNLNIKQIVDTVYKMNSFIYAKKNFFNQYKSPKKNFLKEGKIGFVNNFDTATKKVYLTIDLCDGNERNFNDSLFDFLQQNKIPAIVFVSLKWLSKNYVLFEKIKKNTYIEFANHGVHHYVPSVICDSQFHVPCTKNIENTFLEIAINHFWLQKKLDKTIRFYRPATLFSDSVTYQICKFLNIQLLGANTFGLDVFFKGKEVNKWYQKLIKKIKPGDVLLFHGNHKEWKQHLIIKKLYEGLKCKNIYFALP